MGQARQPRSVAALATAIVVSVTSQAFSAGEATYSAVDAYVESERQALHVPGLALGIVQDGETVHVRGFGRADPSGRPVTPDTPFVLASLSKSFTALAILQLVEAGELQLDQPVQRYLPEFRVADTSASARITLRHLLNQTSGFPTVCGRRSFVEFDRRPDPLASLVRDLANVDLERLPGAAYAYSNCNYYTLGLVVQKVSGEDFGNYIRGHILQPLGMAHSFAAGMPASANGLAMGHRSWFGFPVPYEEPFSQANLPSGFIISSARDMARYLAAHLDGGRRDGAVLSPAGFAELHRPAASEGGGETFYAMGWHVGTINGRPAVWHPGDRMSYQSFMALVPEERLGVVILSNTHDLPAIGRFNSIAAGVINTLTGLRQPVPARIYDSLLIRGVVVGMVTLQLAGMIASVRRLRRWRRRPDRVPSGWPGYVMHVVLPLLLNLLWAAYVLIRLPRVFAPLPVLTTMIPDLGFLLVGSGLVAFAWAVARTVWYHPALIRVPAPHQV